MNTTLLARVPFLADVPADRLRADLPLLQPFSVGPDEVLIQEGEVDDALLIILEGSVQVEVGDPALVVAEARAGEILGETALFRPAWRREATLRTQTACRIIVLGGPAIAALRSAGSPTLAAIERHALQSIARRLRRVALNAPPEVLEALPDDAPPSLLSRLTSWLWGEGARAHPQQPPDVEACLAQAFPDLPPAVCAALAQDFTAEPFFAEQPIASTEEHAPPLRILAAGQVELRDPRGPAFEQRVVGRLGPGDLIDPVRAVHGHMGQTMAVAQTWGWTLTLPRDVLQQRLRDATPQGQALRRILYDALFADLVARNTAWHERWIRRAA